MKRKLKVENAKLICVCVFVCVFVFCVYLRFIRCVGLCFLEKLPASMKSGDSKLG